jgi:hypothetical protein
MQARKASDDTISKKNTQDNSIMETPSKCQILQIKKENTIHDCAKNITFDECSFKMNSIDKSKVNFNLNHTSEIINS